MRPFRRRNIPQIITPIDILSGATDPEMAAITVNYQNIRSYKIVKEGVDYVVREENKSRSAAVAGYYNKFRLNLDNTIRVYNHDGNLRAAEPSEDQLERFGWVIERFENTLLTNRAEEELRIRQQGINERLGRIKNAINFVAPRVSFDIGASHYECSGDDANNLIIRKVTGDRVEDFVRIETAADGTISFSKKGQAGWVESNEVNDVSVLEGALTNRTPITQQQADMDDVCRAMPANVEVRIGDDAFIKTVTDGAPTIYKYTRDIEGLLAAGAIEEVTYANLPGELKNFYVDRVGNVVSTKDARTLAADFIAVLDDDIADGGYKVTKSTEMLSGLRRTVYNFDGKKYYQAAVGGILHEVDAVRDVRDVALDSIGVVERTVGIKGKFDLGLTREQRDERKAIAESVKKAGWTGSVEIPVPDQLTADLLRTASVDNANISFGGTTYRCAPFGNGGARYSISSVDNSSIFIVEVPSVDGDLKVKKVSRSRILPRSKAKIESDLKADAELLAGITGQFSANVQATSLVRDGIIGDIGNHLTNLIDDLSAADGSLARDQAQKLAHDFLNLTNIFIPDISNPNSAVFYNSVSKKSLLSSRGDAVRGVLAGFARDNAERFAASPNLHLKNLAAIFYLNGIGVVQNKVRALGLLQDLEAEEYIPAKSNIVEGFYRRDPEAPLMNDALLEAEAIRDLAQQVSDAGYAPGQYVYGLLHERKLCGVGALLVDDARETEAIRLYEKAANRGDVRAKSRAAEYYFGRDEAKMLRYANEAAKMGDADAQYNLSRHYAAKKEWADAVSYGELAYNQDRTNARYQNSLGTVLEGTNDPGDKARVFGLYSDAAAQGYELGLYNLQRLYREDGLNKNDEKADILENLLLALKEDKEVTSADGTKWKVEYYFDELAPQNSGFVIKTNPADPAAERSITFRQISGKDEGGYNASKNQVLEIVDLIKEQIAHETNIRRFGEIFRTMPKDILVKQGEYYFVATGTPVELHQYKFNEDGSVDPANSRNMDAAYRDRDHLQIVVDALYYPAANAPKVVVGKTLSELSKQCFEIIKNDPDAKRDGGMTTAVYAYDGKKYYLGGTFSSALYEMNANGRGQKVLSILEVITKAHEVEAAQYQRGVAIDGITYGMKTALINGIKVDLGDADGNKRLEAIAIANEFLGLKERSGTGAIGDEYVYYGITKQRAEELSEAPGGNALKAFAVDNIAVFAASNNPNLRNLAGVFCELGIHVDPVAPNPAQALGHYQEAANTGSQAAMDNVIRCYKGHLGFVLDADVASGTENEQKEKFARRGTTLEALRWAVENEVGGVTYDPRNPAVGFVVTVNRGNAEVNINVTANTGFDEEGLEERIRKIERRKASTRGLKIPEDLDLYLLNTVSANGVEIGLNNVTNYRCSKVSDREYSIASVDGDRKTKVFKVEVSDNGNLIVTKAWNSIIPSVRTSARRKAELEEDNELLANVTAGFKQRLDNRDFSLEESEALVAKFRKCFVDNTIVEDYVFTASGVEYTLSQTAENRWTLKEIAGAGAELVKFARDPVSSIVAITLPDDNAVDAPQFWQANTILQSLQRERTPEDLTAEFMQIMRRDSAMKDVSVRGNVYNIYSFGPRLAGKQYYSDAIMRVLHEYNPNTRASTKLTSKQIAQKIDELKQAQLERGVEDELTQVLKNRLIADIKVQLPNHNEVEAIRIANQFLGFSHEANSGSVESISEVLVDPVKDVLEKFARDNIFTAADLGAGILESGFAVSRNANLRNLAGVFCELGIHVDPVAPNPAQALGHYQEAANTGSQAAMDNVIRCYKGHLGFVLDADVAAGTQEQQKEKFARRGTTLEALRWAVENEVGGVTYDRLNHPRNGFLVTVNRGNAEVDINVTANTGFDEEGLEERIKEIETQKASTRGIIIPDGLDESMLIYGKAQWTRFNSGTTEYVCSKDGSGYNVIDQNNGGKFGYRVTFKEGLPTVTKIVKKDRASTWAGYSEHKEMPFAPKDHAEFAAIIRNGRVGFDQEIVRAKTQIVADIDAAKVFGQLTVQELTNEVRGIIDSTGNDAQKLAEATKIVESFLGISDSFVDQEGNIHFYGQHLENGEEVKEVLEAFAKANRQAFADDTTPDHLKLLAFNFYYTDEEPTVGGNRTDQEAAFTMVEALAEEGNPGAKNRLGVCYQQGFGVKQNAAQAKKLFKEAADQGYPVAYCRLGTIYSEDHSTLGTQTSCYATSANLGFVIGMHQTGMQYLEFNPPVYRDNKKAFKYFQEAANHGYAPSLYQLGVCYEKGIGGTDLEKPIEADRKAEAFRLYKAAAELGNYSAIESLARCYEKGIGTPENHDLAKTLNSLLLIMQIGAEVEHDLAKYKVEFDKDKGFVVSDVKNQDRKFEFSVKDGLVANPSVDGNEDAILIAINANAVIEKRKADGRKTTIIQRATRQVTGAIRTPEKLEGVYGRKLLERASENETEVCYGGQNYRCFFVRNHDGTIAHDGTAQQNKNRYVLYPIDHAGKREESKARYEISFSNAGLATVTKLNSTVLGRNLGWNLTLFGESRASVFNSSLEDGFFAKLVDKIDTVERSRQTNFIAAGECQAVTGLALEDFFGVYPNQHVRASFEIDVYGEKEKYEITRYDDEYYFDKITNDSNDGEKATRSYKIIDLAGNPRLQIPNPRNVGAWIDCEDSAEFAKVQKLLVALASVVPPAAKINKQDAQYRDALRLMEKDQQYSHNGQFFIKTVGEGGSTTLHQYQRDANGLVTNIKKDPETSTEQLPDKAFLHDAVDRRDLTDITGLTAGIENTVRSQLNEVVDEDEPIPDGYGKRTIADHVGEKYTYSANGLEYCIEGDVLHKVEYVVDEKEWLTIRSPKPYYKATPLNAFEIVQASSDFIARQQQEADDVVIKDLIVAVRGHIPGEEHAAEEKAKQIVHDFLGFNDRGTRLYPTDLLNEEVSPEIKTILHDFAVDQITKHDQFAPVARVDHLAGLAGDAPEFSSPALLENVVAVFCENNVGLGDGVDPNSARRALTVVADREEAARDLYQASANAGNPHAQNNLGRLKEEGLIGVAQNQTEAFNLYRQAAAQGNKTGFENVARCLKRGNALDQAQANTLEVMQWATGHADLKDERWSGWVRGEEYSVSEYNPRKGFVVTNSRNQEIALVKYDGSVVKVVKGQEVGEYRNFQAIVTQIKTRKEERARESHILEGNVEEARKALVADLQKTPPNRPLMDAAEATVFAKCFFESVTAPPAPERYQAKSELLASLKPEQRARLEEFTHAHVVAFSKSKSAHLRDLAGQIYFNGIGVDKDYAKARECFEGSVDKSYPMAEYHLAEMFLIGGRGVEKNERKAFEKFEVAARQGFQPAIAALADCYKNGVGCDRNLVLAEALYDRTIPRVNPGDHAAINGIDSVNKDLYPSSGRIEFLLKADNQEGALTALEAYVATDPQYYEHIGRIHEKGYTKTSDDEYVPENYLEATKQYDLGARAGATNSMRALAELYDQGRASASVLARSEYQADKLRRVANFFEACAQLQGSEDIRIAVPSSSSTKYLRGVKDVYQVSKAPDGSYILSIDGKEKEGFKVDGKGNFYVRKEINGVVRDIYEERGFQENPVFLKVQNAMILSNNEQVRVSASGIEDRILQDLTRELAKINVENPEMFARDFLGLNPESGATFGGNSNAATLRYCHGNNFREINNVAVSEVLREFATRNREYCEANDCPPHLTNLAGMFHEMGFFNDGNPYLNQAELFYENAANKGYVPAEHNWVHVRKNRLGIDEREAINRYKIIANKGYLPSVKAAAEIISNQVLLPFADPNAPTRDEIAAVARQENAKFLSNLAEMRINGGTILDINYGTAQQKSYVVSNYDPERGFTLNLIDRTGLKSKEGFRVDSLEEAAPQIHKIGANGNDMPLDAAAQRDLTEMLTVLERSNKQVAQQHKQCLDAAYKPRIRSLTTASPQQVGDVKVVKPSLKKPPEVHKEKVKKEEVLTPKVQEKVKAETPKVKVDPNLDKAVPKSSCIVSAAMTLRIVLGRAR